MILYRLDYWLILNNPQDSVSVTNIIPSVKTHHAAISLDFNISQNHVKGPGYWEMNCFLLDDDNYQGPRADVTCRITCRCIWDWIKYILEHMQYSFQNVTQKKKR